MQKAFGYAQTQYRKQYYHFSNTNIKFYRNSLQRPFPIPTQTRRYNVLQNAVFDVNIPRLIDPTQIPRLIDPTQIPRIVTETVPQNMIPYVLFVTASILFLIFADIAYYVLKWIAQTDMSAIDEALDIDQRQNKKNNPNSDSKLQAGEQREKMLVENKVAEERSRGLWWLTFVTAIALYLMPLLNKEDALTP
eukprot:TRINITY_DN11291_c0_g1_i4.p7 TRINITY_DN11291_c0_g1~~TRINITY_DN11291_c0_g1_i4.p7  ORF type:complete len:208 (-),score=21.72 TRINITY_DN11291_c0_g1_i4:1279-1854(-)